MSFLTYTSSMEAQLGSVSTLTEPGSSQSMTDQTLSHDGPARSEDQDSDGSSMTSHSEFDHDNGVMVYAGDPQTIHNFPTTAHHYLQYPSEYQNPATYPPRIQEEDGHLANTNPPQAAQQAVRTPPQTSHAGPSLSQPFHVFNPPRQNNTTEENIRHYRRTLPMSPPSTPHSYNRPRPRPNIHTHITQELDITQIQDWERNLSPEERMRLGRLRWERAEEGQRNLDEHLSNPALDEPFRTWA